MIPNPYVCCVSLHFQSHIVSHISHQYPINIPLCSHYSQCYCITIVFQPSYYIPITCQVHSPCAIHYSKVGNALRTFMVISHMSHVSDWSLSLKIQYPKSLIKRNCHLMGIPKSQTQPNHNVVDIPFISLYIYISLTIYQYIIESLLSLMLTAPLSHTYIYII